MSDELVPQESNPTVTADGRTPGLIKNLLSLIGIAIALVAAANIAFLVFIDFMSQRPSPYIGIFAYMIIPGIMVFGLLMIPLGMLLERNRRRSKAPSVIPRFPRIDLNNPKQRASFVAVVAFSVVFIAISADR